MSLIITIIILISIFYAITTIFIIWAIYTAVISLKNIATELKELRRTLED